MNMHKGFTLIEVLAVISILGILAIMIVSRIEQAKEDEKNSHTDNSYMTEKECNKKCKLVCE